MDLNKINNIAFKVVAGILCLFWLVGSAGTLVNHAYLKALPGLIAIPLVAYTVYYYPASIKTWALVLGLFVVVMYTVGIIGN